MSTITKTAISTAMKNDGALVALLAPHPSNAALPAIFNAYKSQAPPVYNCLTYRIESTRPNARFRPPPAAGGGPSTIEDEYLQCESWSQKPDSADIEAISLRLIALFDGQPIPLSVGRVYRAEMIMSSLDNYDNVLNAWFGLTRFRLRISKG